MLTSDSNQRVLILAPIGLGNYLMLTPALELLVETLGSANLAILALRKGVAEMATASGNFSEVFVWDPDKESIAKGLGIISKIRKFRPSVTVSLFPTRHPGFAVFGRLSGAQARIGFQYSNASRFPDLLTHRLPVNPDLHDTDQNFSFVEGVLEKQDHRIRALTFPIPTTHPLEDELMRARYFVCHPGSSSDRGMKEKRLPPETFANLIERIHQTHAIQCVLIGGPEEAELRHEITSLSPNAILDYRSRSLAEVGGLIRHSKFYLGNDSGLMHSAVSIGKPCAVIFGPTDNRRAGPYTDGLRFGRPQPHAILRHPELACSPCWTVKTVGNNPPCIYGDIRCLKQLRAEHVWTKLDGFVGSVLGEVQAPHS